MQAAEVITREWVEEIHGAQVPKAETVVRTDDVQGWKIAKARDILDRIERGDLIGGRFEFCHYMPAMVYVENFPPVPVESEEERAQLGSDMKRTVRLVRVTFEPKTPKLEVV